MQLTNLMPGASPAFQTAASRREPRVESMTIPGCSGPSFTVWTFHQEPERSYMRRGMQMARAIMAARVVREAHPVTLLGDIREQINTRFYISGGCVRKEAG